MFDPHGMNTQDCYREMPLLEWEGREAALYEQAVQMSLEGGDRSDIWERLDKTDATEAEKASIIRKLAAS